jgi:hypothetical protein
MRSVYGFDSSRLCDKSRCDLATYRQCLMIWHFRPTLGSRLRLLPRRRKGKRRNVDPWQTRAALSEIFQNVTYWSQTLIGLQLTSRDFRCVVAFQRVAETTQISSEDLD